MRSSNSEPLRIGFGKVVYFFRKNSAVDLRAEALKVEEGLFALMTAVGGEEKKRLYLKTFERRLDDTISLQQTLARTDPSAVRLALRAVLGRKGWPVAGATAEMNALRRRSSPEDLASLYELKSIREDCADMVSMGPPPGSGSTVAYTDKLKALAAREEAITRRMAGAAAAMIDLGVSVETVQQALPEGSVLVEVASRVLRVRPAGSMVFDEPFGCLTESNASGFGQPTR